MLRTRRTGRPVTPGRAGAGTTPPQPQQQVSGRAPAIRFRVPDGSTAWTDGFAGERSYDVAKELGDFVIAKSDGTPAYQLAVVVDDAAAGVTQVVRGDDLLDSTPRQMLLYRALNAAERIPDYYHLPLVVGADGRRLAKRHGDTRLAHFREAGVPAGRVLRVLAEWLGMQDVEAENAAGLISRFTLQRIPHEPVVWDPAEARL